MLNVSNEFKDLMKRNTDFREYAEVTFVDGTKMLLDDRDFTVTNNYLTDGAGISSLPVGVAIQKRIQIEILNDHEQFEHLDFYGAKIRLYLTFQLSETVEKLEKGIYTVVTPETHGETVVINAYDDMYRADKSYSTSLTFPTTLKMVLIDICSACDIPLLSTTFKNDDMIIQTAPAEEYTFRQVIGYIAMIAGGNARINVNGYLEIKSYEFMENVYDGGDFTFSNSDTVLDGGDFTFSNEDETVDGGAFIPWSQDSTGLIGDIPEDRILDSWNPGSLTVDTNDITITGVKITCTVDNEQKTELVGEEGYVISVQNPLLDGDVSSGISVIADSLIGLKFRKFEGDHIANPLIEFMDMVFVKDRRGRIYKSVITDVNFNVCGFTTVKNSAASFVKNETVYANSGAVTEVQTRKLIERERTDRELAQEQLEKALANSSGLYPTDVLQPDGSKIYYLHDKPTLSESKTVIKLTAEAIGVSTDGGKTYPYGFTVTGEMITRILSTEGVNADWIRTGTLDAKNIAVKNLSATDVHLDGSFVSEAGNYEARLEYGEFHFGLKNKTTGIDIRPLINSPTIELFESDDRKNRVSIDPKGIVIWGPNGEFSEFGQSTDGKTILISHYINVTQLKVNSPGSLYPYWKTLIDSNGNTVRDSDGNIASVLCGYVSPQ